MRPTSYGTASARSYAAHPSARQATRFFAAAL